MRVLPAFHLIAFAMISAHLAICLKRVSFVSILSVFNRNIHHALNHLLQVDIFVAYMNYGKSFLNGSLSHRLMRGEICLPMARSLHPQLGPAVKSLKEV